MKQCLTLVLSVTGVAGFRGAATTMWVEDKSSNVQRPTGWSDPSLMKSDNPDLGCRKCQGVVYDLEAYHAKVILVLEVSNVLY